MLAKEVGDNQWNRWRPVRTRYWQRFKDREWRLFGTKNAWMHRENIMERHWARAADWNKRRIGGMIGATLRAYKQEFSQAILNDFILYDCLGDKDLQPQLFRMRER